MPQWSFPCLGVSASHSRHRSFWKRLFSRGIKRPMYSGSGIVDCYRDTQGKDYLVPEQNDWRIVHDANEHTTYVYADKHNDGLVATLLHVIGSQYGCYLLFASCVAQKGEAILLTGKGGAGKTTRCLELVQQGATYMGDDLVLVYHQGRQMMVGALLLPIKQDTGGKQKERKDILSDTSQILLNAPLTAIYWLQESYKNNPNPQIAPIPKDAVMEKILLLTNTVHLHADRMHFMETISTLCEEVPAYYYQ